MSSKSEFDWIGFFVQFFFGSIVGALVGMQVWSRSPYASSSSTVPGYLFVGGGMIVFGLITGFWGDRFWHGLLDSLRK